MGDRHPAIQKPQMRRLSLRCVVHGLRYRPDIYFPLLAPAGLRRIADPLRGCLRHQPHIGNLRLLLQLPVDSPDGARKSPVPGAGREHAEVPVYIMAVESVVGAAV